MYLTRFLISCPCGNRHTFMVNGLTGALDLVSNSTFRSIKDCASGVVNAHLPDSITEPLIERGYLFDSVDQENDFFETMKVEYKEACAREPFGFWICPTYGCNLRCTYCFEGESRRDHSVMSEQQIEAAFQAMQSLNTTGVPPMFHIYGGEPFLEETQEAVASIIDKAKTAGYPINIITNGTNIPLFVPLLKLYRESLNFVQVTLDGIQEIHDRKRIYADDRGSFNEVVQGIDLLVDNQIPVQIRANLDTEGINRFGEFAQFIRDKDWHPGPDLFLYFTTVNNRHCGKLENCPTELDAAKLVVKLRTDFPETDEWEDFDVFQVLDTLIINLGYVKARSIQPKFHQCSANWNRLQIFCPDNLIYSCPSAVGDAALSIGSFFPNLSFDDSKMASWQYGSVDELQKCSDCPAMLLCGGGCTLRTIRMQGKQDCSQSVTLIKSAVRELSSVILAKLS